MASTSNGSAWTFERELKEEEEKEEKEEDDDNDNDGDDEEEERRRQMGELPTLPLLSHHRGELLYLLEKLLSFHQWKDAAGVVSQLLRSSPPRTLSDKQLRRLFMAACEIEKQLGDADNFLNGAKQILEGYIEQMLSPEMIASAKLEVANFYLSQGEYEDAYHYATNAQISLRGNLAQDIDRRGNPFVNLTLGMICYKSWYRNLPEDMKIQSCDERGTRGIYQSDVEAGFGSPTSHGSLEDPSVFLVRGLDVRLLPIRLRRMHEDLEYDIQEYRQLAKDKMYEEGVQCLRNALHSSPPKSASLDALEPLIQLLLLGDRVAEAAAKLAFSCQRLNYSAIPFSLRARFLECFAPQEIDTISSCYQAAVKIDATCSSNVEGLIRIHGNRSDENSMMVLLEMIPRHIDAMVPSRVSVGQDGGVSIGREVKTSVWEEMASCFLKVTIYFRKIIISEILSERVARATWKTRFRWWKEKHFREISLSSQAHSRMSEQACVSGASNAGSDSNKRRCLKSKEHYDPALENKNEATCNYCNTNVRGMQEMKEHLIGKKGYIRACNSVPPHVKMELEKLLNGKDKQKEQSTLGLLPLLPGDDKLLACKAACASHIYGPSDEYVVEILKVLIMHGINDHISFLQTHMQSTLNFRGLLGSC
ncbi:TAF RNA polymerase I subunit A [Carex littledalei]|uniref:TAF RNA polymerase I subunit A n=1 Tax=Carex littledalei TaxID=544730 RepID=A0A833QXE5_9POAL|nr:TAF RNA polymerase I subunit A [Carex littledalei]